MDSNGLHIGEAARLLGVTPEHLRTLERTGRIPQVGRDFAGRVYAASDIALLKSLGVGQRPQRLKILGDVLGRTSVGS